MPHFWWSRECKNLVSNKAILTEVVVLTILDHCGPVRLPAVPQPLPIKSTSSNFVMGKPTREKLPTQTKAQFAQTLSEQFVQIVRPLSY